jgi:hypothetical protein
MRQNLLLFPEHFLKRFLETACEGDAKFRKPKADKPLLFATHPVPTSVYHCQCPIGGFNFMLSWNLKKVHMREWIAIGKTISFYFLLNIFPMHRFLSICM